MVDSPRCVYGDECPKKRLRERRIIESLDKYRKETFEKYDLCDGTLLNKVTVIEGDSINKKPWNYGRVEEKWITEDKGMSKKPRSWNVNINEENHVDRNGIDKHTICSSPFHPTESKPEKNSYDNLMILLKKQEELPHILYRYPTPTFPICEYRPPHPPSLSSHISEKTLSIYDSFHSRKSLTSTPRRFSIKVDERSINDSKAISPKAVTTKMEPKYTQEIQYENKHLVKDSPLLCKRSSATRISDDHSRSNSPQLLTRYGIDRYSNRSQSTGRHFYPEECASPVSKDDILRCSFQIPVQRRILAPHSQLEEGTVTKETFERIVTTRKLFASTLV